VTNFGGIAGTTSGAAQLINVSVTGTATLSASGTEHSIGSIAGQMTGTSIISNAYSSLNLTVNNSLGSLYAGGLVGYISSGNAQLLNADYRQGNISVSSGSSSNSFVGGGVGYISGGTVNGCSSLAGSFEGSKTEGSYVFYTGGFFGYVSGGTINNCYSDNSVVINATSNYTGTVSGGGFAGYITGTSTITEYCYALGDVSVSGHRGINAGGFAGNATGITSYCYAAGKVNVYSKAGTSPYAGGFAGQCYSMNNCYATGDVFVDAPSNTSDIYAGSLSGSSSSSVRQCFASGSVTVQRNTSGTVNAGGLMGSKGTSTLEYCAALGASVTVTGPGT
jgi:hypothetical protein